MKRNSKHDLKITVHPILSLYTPSNNSLTLMLSCQTFFTMIHHKSFINSPIDRLEYPLLNFRHFCVIRSYAPLILKEFSYLGEPFHSLNLKPLFCKFNIAHFVAISIHKYNSTNLKFPQGFLSFPWYGYLVNNRLLLLCDCFCCRYYPNKASLRTLCLVCNFSLPTDGLCTATCFLFVCLSSCFSFF